jgi:hypothetical protein
MKTRRHLKKKRQHKSKKNYKSYKKSSDKKWVTAVDAAQSTLKRTGSLMQARKALRLQAYQNARKLFGSTGESL